MNYQLTDEQTMLLDSLRGFLEEEIHPRARGCVHMSNKRLLDHQPKGQNV